MGTTEPSMLLAAFEGITLKENLIDVPRYDEVWELLKSEWSVWNKSCIMIDAQ